VTHSWLFSGNRRVYLLGIVVLFLFLFTLRAVHPTADPPSRLSWSGGLFGDEPAYAHNARNKAVFGKWVLDEWNPFLYNPILTLFDYISFKIFGTGFFALRMVPLFWGLLSIILVYDTLRRGFGTFWVAALGVLLLETNYFFLMYTRLSLSDTMLTNWMILTLFLWSLGTKHAWARFFSGLAAIAVFSCKPTAIYFAVVVGATYLFSCFKESDGKINFREIATYVGPFLAGLGLGLVVWLVFYYRPFHGEIARYSREWSKLSMPRSLGDFADRVLGRHAPIVFKHFSWFPFLLLVGWCYLPISIFRIIRRWWTVRPVEFFVTLWFVVGYFALSGFRYRPPRYFVSLVPPVIFLAICGLVWLVSVGRDEEAFFHKSPFFVVFLAWLGLTVYLINRYIRFTAADFIWGAAVSLVFFIIILRWTKKRPLPSVKRVASYGFAVALVSLILVHNLSLYGRWWKKPQYKEITISREIGKRVHQGTIAGLWAPLVCMENKNRALCIAPGWFNDRAPYEKYRFTHLFLWRGNRDAELSMVRRVLGRAFLKNRLKPVARYYIKDAWAILFKVSAE